MTGDTATPDQLVALTPRSCSIHQSADPGEWSVGVFFNRKRERRRRSILHANGPLPEEPIKM